MFCKLAESVLPALAATAGDRLRVWSAGCGSGEEPYSVSLLWQLKLRQLLVQCRLEIVATDASEVMLRRAMQACYGDGSLRELPTQWRRRAFQTTPTGWCLRPEFRAPVELRLSDIRDESPAGPFQLVLCRYLAFTYFDRNLQQRMLGRIRECLARDGALVVGSLKHCRHAQTLTSSSGCRRPRFIATRTARVRSRFGEHLTGEFCQHFTGCGA